MPTPIKPYTKKELKDLYQISYYTLKKWLSKIKNLGDYKRPFTPAQVSKIFAHLGEPEA